jgi:hypothetical protein
VLGWFLRRNPFQFVAAFVVIVGFGWLFSGGYRTVGRGVAAWSQYMIGTHRDSVGGVLGGEGEEESENIETGGISEGVSAAGGLIGDVAGVGAGVIRQMMGLTDVGLGDTGELVLMAPVAELEMIGTDWDPVYASARGVVFRNGVGVNVGDRILSGPLEGHYVVKVDLRGRMLYLNGIRIKIPATRVEWVRIPDRQERERGIGGVRLGGRRDG